MRIKILITGGSIDDLEYDSPEKAPKSPKTYIPELLKRARVTADHDVEILMSKDSKFITDEDREIILKKCQDCEEEKIVITHGTATMSTTAKYLGERNLQKTIVLLGSAVPANKEDSDALFNLGAALAAAQTLPAGVYVTMSGEIFSWDNVKKNSDTGFFETEK
ncbi:MAG: asparaginase [Candidatus Aenigmarchaeota archaeon]|nr:asparaginase [Candidatus Aenigmarchaeota archaeon]